MRTWRGLAIVLAVVLVWGGNYVYTLSYELVRPLIVPQYVDQYVDTQFEMTLDYITNRHGEPEVTYMYFPELLTRGVYHKLGSGNWLGRYMHQRLAFDFPSGLSENLAQGEELLLTEVIVVYADGTEERHPVGQIRLIGAEQREEQRSFRSVMGSSSSNGNSSHTYEVTAPMTLTELVLSSPEHWDGILHYELTADDGEKREGVPDWVEGPTTVTFPQALSASGSYWIDSSIRIPRDDPRYYAKLQSYMMLRYTDEGGALREQRIRLDYEPRLSDEEWTKWVREEGETKLELPF